MRHQITITALQTYPNPPKLDISRPMFALAISKLLLLAQSPPHQYSLKPRCNAETIAVPANKRLNTGNSQPIENK